MHDRPKLPDGVGVEGSDGEVVHHNLFANGARGINRKGRTIGGEQGIAHPKVGGIRPAPPNDPERVLRRGFDHLGRRTRAAARPTATALRRRVRDPDGDGAVRANDRDRDSH